MDNNRLEAERWYRQGRRDMQTAGRNRDNRDYEVACFLYQQAAEKLLKAFLYLQGERGVMGRSTFQLAGRCAGYDRAFADLYDSCRKLDAFYIPTRYPNGLPGGTPFEFFTDNHCQRGETACRNIFQVVESFF